MAIDGKKAIGFLSPKISELKEKINNMQSGIKSITNEGNKLIFVLGDDSILEVVLTGLSDNNYSNDDKDKLYSLDEELLNKFSYVDGKLLYDNVLVDKEIDLSIFYTKTEIDTKLNNKIDKVIGKELSSNDFTDTLKDKINNIEANANNYVHPTTHEATIITQDATHRFVSDSEKTEWNDKYTKNEVDNKINQVVTDLDWKESVATYSALSTTYPSPQDGWTVNVKDTDITYRWSGSEWISISANAIPLATSSVDGKMSKADKSKLDGIDNNAQVNTITGIKGDSESNYRVGNVNITKANIGLGNLDNTSDLNKPISTAVQTALDGKANSLHTHDDRYYTESEIDNKISSLDTKIEANKTTILNTIGNEEMGTTATTLKGAVKELGLQLNDCVREIQTITLKNSLEYPFNNSKSTVSLLTTRNNLNYNIDYEVINANNVGDIIISDKQLNGFKIEYTGSNTQVQVKLFIQGGKING